MAMISKRRLSLSVRMPKGAVLAVADFEPPPGKIIQTEEVVVEYEPNYASLHAPLGAIPTAPGPLGNIGWAM